MVLTHCYYYLNYIRKSKFAPHRNTALGQLAFEIRSVWPPTPYSGANGLDLESFLEMRSKGNVKRFQKPAPGLNCPGQQGRECDEVIWEFCLNSFVKFYLNVFLCSSAKEILGMPNCFTNQELDQASEWQVAAKLNATCSCKLVKQYLARRHAASLGTVQSREGLLPARNLCWDGETVKFKLSRWSGCELSFA